MNDNMRKLQLNITASLIEQRILHAQRFTQSQRPLETPH